MNRTGRIPKQAKKQTQPPSKPGEIYGSGADGGSPEDLVAFSRSAARSVPRRRQWLLSDSSDSEDNRGLGNDLQRVGGSEDRLGASLLRKQLCFAETAGEDRGEAVPVCSDTFKAEPSLKIAAKEAGSSKESSPVVIFPSSVARKNKKGKGLVILDDTDGSNASANVQDKTERHGEVSPFVGRSNGVSLQPTNHSAIEVVSSASSRSPVPSAAPVRDSGSLDIRASEHATPEDTPRFTPAVYAADLASPPLPPCCPADLDESVASCDAGNESPCPHPGIVTPQRTPPAGRTQRAGSLTQQQPVQTEQSQKKPTQRGGQQSSRAPDLSPMLSCSTPTPRYAGPCNHTTPHASRVTTPVWGGRPQVSQAHASPRVTPPCAHENPPTRLALRITGNGVGGFTPVTDVSAQNGGDRASEVMLARAGIAPVNAPNATQISPTPLGTPASASKPLGGRPCWRGGGRQGQRMTLATPVCDDSQGRGGASGGLLLGAGHWAGSRDGSGWGVLDAARALLASATKPSATMASVTMAASATPPGGCGEGTHDAAVPGILGGCEASRSPLLGCGTTGDEKGKEGRLEATQAHDTLDGNAGIHGAVATSRAAQHLASARPLPLAAQCREPGGSPSPHSCLCDSPTPTPSSTPCVERASPTTPPRAASPAEPTDLLRTRLFLGPPAAAAAVSLAHNAGQVAGCAPVPDGSAKADLAPRGADQASLASSQAFHTAASNCSHSSKGGHTATSLCLLSSHKLGQVECGSSLQTGGEVGPEKSNHGGADGGIEEALPLRRAQNTPSGGADRKPRLCQRERGEAQSDTAGRSPLPRADVSSVVVRGPPLERGAIAADAGDAGWMGVPEMSTPCRQVERGAARGLVTAGRGDDGVGDGSNDNEEGGLFLASAARRRHRRCILEDSDDDGGGDRSNAVTRGDNGTLAGVRRSGAWKSKGDSSQGGTDVIRVISLEDEREEEEEDGDGGGGGDASDGGDDCVLVVDEYGLPWDQPRTPVSRGAAARSSGQQILRACPATEPPRRKGAWDTSNRHVAPAVGVPPQRKPLSPFNRNVLPSHNDNNVPASKGATRERVPSPPLGNVAPPTCKPAKRGGVEVVARPCAGLGPAACVSGPAFQRQKDVLTAAIYADANAGVFGGRLPASLEISWSPHLTRTAGTTSYKHQLRKDGPPLHIASITLSTKVLDNSDKLRQTLCHEMCHVAAWLLDKCLKPPHGKIFKKWASLVQAQYPDVQVTTCHNYKIHCRFQYKCTSATCGVVYGRHSKSIDVERARCGVCSSRLQLLPRLKADGTPAKSRAPSGFSLFVKENFASEKEKCGPNTPHKEIMRLLSSRWREIKQAPGSGENEIL